jgi:hypothetical protein
MLIDWMMWRTGDPYSDMHSFMEETGSHEVLINRLLYPTESEYKAISNVDDELI